MIPGADLTQARPNCEECFRRWAQVEKDLEALDVMLRGNGRTGINTRVKLLEEKIDGLIKLVWAIALMSIGLIIEAAWQIIAGA